MVYLETERMILRDYQPSDKESYFKLKHDSTTMYYLQDIKLHSMEEADKDFAQVLADMASENRRYYFLHMERRSDHQQIGCMGYTVTEDTPLGKLVHVGYFLYPQFWNQGYATEAFSRVLEFAFCENNVYRVTTGCLAENKGSERVMNKCGMIKEAEHVDSEWHDGKLKTRVEYRLLKKEWVEHKELER